MRKLIFETTNNTDKDRQIITICITNINITLGNLSIPKIVLLIKQNDLK